MKSRIRRSKHALRPWQTALNKWSLRCGLALAIISCLVVSACRKRVLNDVERRFADAAMTNSVLAETVAAGHFLKELQMQGRLPGLSRDDHGSAESENVQFTESEVAKYPVTRTFYIIKEGDQSKSRYYYKFYRESNVYEWRLTKAWKTDSDGQLIEELEVRP